MDNDIIKHIQTAPPLQDAIYVIGEGPASGKLKST
jgi:hypothetical protein